VNIRSVVFTYSTDGQTDKRRALHNLLPEVINLTESPRRNALLRTTCTSLTVHLHEDNISKHGGGSVWSI